MPLKDFISVAELVSLCKKEDLVDFINRVEPERLGKKETVY